MRRGGYHSLVLHEDLTNDGWLICNGTIDAHDDEDENTPEPEVNSANGMVFSDNDSNDDGNHESDILVNITGAGADIREFHELPPDPGGAITAEISGASSVKLEWPEALDYVPPESEMTYHVYQSENDDLSGAEWWSGREPLYSGTGLTYTAENLSDPSKAYFNVVVENDVGIKSSYEMVNASPAPDSGGGGCNAGAGFAGMLLLIPVLRGSLNSLNSLKARKFKK